MRIKSIKISFDARKLEKQLQKTIINNTIGDFANVVKKDVVDGLKKGRDIYGGKLKPIQPITREIRRLRGNGGTKPLIASGDMMKSVKVRKGRKKGKYNNKTLVAESYGNGRNKNVHQTGFRLSNEKQWAFEVEGEIFKVGKKSIPARPWFHEQESVSGSKTISTQFDKLAKNYFKQFNKSFSRNRLANILYTFGR